MNEYVIHELTGRPESLFPLLERSGMGVLRSDEAFLYILRGDAGWFLLSHSPGDDVFVKQLLADDSMLRRAAAGAMELYHIDGVLRHDLYVLIGALETEILLHSADVRCGAKGGVGA